MTPLRASALDLGVACPGSVALKAQCPSSDTEAMQRGRRLHVALAQLFCPGWEPRADAPQPTEQDRADADACLQWARETIGEVCP